MFIKEFEYRLIVIQRNYYFMEKIYSQYCCKIFNYCFNRYVSRQNKRKKTEAGSTIEYWSEIQSYKQFKQM